MLGSCNSTWIALNIKGITSFNFHFKKYKLVFKFGFPEISAEIYTNIVKILPSYLEFEGNGTHGRQQKPYCFKDNRSFIFGNFTWETLLVFWRNVYIVHKRVQ